MTKEKEVCVISNIKKQSASSTRLEKKKLMMSQENNVIYRLWTDIKMKERSFRALIDFKASRNFLHWYVVNSLGIQTWSQKCYNQGSLVQKLHLQGIKLSSMNTEATDVQVSYKQQNIKCLSDQHEHWSNRCLSVVWTTEHWVFKWFL